MEFGFFDVMGALGFMWVGAQYEGLKRSIGFIVRIASIKNNVVGVIEKCKK